MAESTVARKRIDGDYSPLNLARVFGARTVEMMADGRDPYVAARLAASCAARVLAERPKVVGYIIASEPWGVANCDRCDGYAIPNHHCPGGAL